MLWWGMSLSSSRDDVIESLGLEEGRHFESKKLATPVIDSHLYTSLGKQLFDLYEKYKVAPQDQRQMERLSYLLLTFTRARNK